MIRRTASIASSSRAPRWALLWLALAGSLACSAYPTKKNLPVNCAVMNAYDLDLVDATYFTMMYGANDHTSDASVSPKVESFPDGPLCGDTTGLHVVGTYYNDWGSLFGFWSFPKKNEAARTGMSFWARAPGPSAKGITILVDDPNTKNPSANCPADAGNTETIIPPGDSGAYCTTYCTPDAGGPTPAPPTYGPEGMPLSSGTSTAPLPANACSNSYQTEISLTSDWAFYTIPFPEFQQQATPDRVPNSVFTMVGTTPDTNLLTSSIIWLTFRMPKGAPYDLWFDRLGFYGPKGPGDGGVVGQ